jgi:hypothetical protein
VVKLFELLAVEAGMKKTFNTLITEAVGTFKGAGHFLGFSKRTLHFAADEQNKDKVDTKVVDETVGAKLDFVGGTVTKVFDLEYQLSRADQHAKSDLVLDGVTIAKDVPVLWFLGMEARLQQLRTMYEAIPTHAPGIRWVADTEQDSKGRVYRAAVDTEGFVTRKEMRVKVLTPATDKHPAQVDKWMEDLAIAKVVTTAWTGTISPAEKSDILGRVDALLQACKAARQRGNTVEAPKDKIGADLVAFLHAGTMPAAV